MPFHVQLFEHMIFSSFSTSLVCLTFKRYMIDIYRNNITFMNIEKIVFGTTFWILCSIKWGMSSIISGSSPKDLISIPSIPVNLFSLSFS